MGTKRTDAGRADEEVIDLTVTGLLRPPQPEPEELAVLRPPDQTGWTGRSGRTTPGRTLTRGDTVRDVLTHRLGDRAVLLHARRVPSTRGTVDHLAVAPSGVWVVQAERLRGTVERRQVGGFFRTDVRLFVAGRDRTRLVDQLQWHHGAIVTAIADDAVPVRAAACFVDADWTDVQEPFRMDDVWIGPPDALADLIAEPGPLDQAGVDRVARLLSERLPAT